MVTVKNISQRMRSVWTWSLLPVLVLYLAPGMRAAHGDLLQEGKQLMDNLLGDEGDSTRLSVDEIGSGLKEALRVGTGNVVTQLGQTGGFNSDPAVHIPLPQSLQDVHSVLGKVGMDSMLDDLELKLNRAAEIATPKAKILFWDAIGQMTLDDVRAIYQGPDDAATRYFEAKMSGPLAAEMQPIVSDSLAAVDAIALYDQAISRYQSLPMVPDAKADLTDYVVAEGMDGIFYYLAREEAAIRSDPAKRTTELLEKVFGAGQ
jgi:hypothetical protein